jgi:hypothetical protein
MDEGPDRIDDRIRHHPDPMPVLPVLPGLL